MSRKEERDNPGAQIDECWYRETRKEKQAPNAEPAALVTGPT